MGPVEIRLRKHLNAGMRLATVPDQATFEVAELGAEALVLLFGEKKARTRFTWQCLEGIPQFLQGKGWVEIRSVHNTQGVPGSLDGYFKTNGPKRTSGGYMAGVLQTSDIVEVRSNRPAAVRLRSDWRCQRARSLCSDATGHYHPED